MHSTLGPGLLESVYEEALGYEFQLRRIPYERQKEIVIFDNFSVFSVVSFDNTVKKLRRVKYVKYIMGNCPRGKNRTFRKD